MDILFGINLRNPLWCEPLGRVPVDILTQHDIDAALWDVHGKNGDMLADDIERLRPRVVINCAMLIHSGRFGNLARQFPRVRWVTTCHSSQSDLARNECWLRQQGAFIELARSLPNCFYALVDNRTRLRDAFNCNRVIHLSNCARYPDLETSHSLHEPPVVSLICDWSQLKNLPNQLAAISLVSRSRPCKLLLYVSHDRRSSAAAFAHSLGLDADVRLWQPWSAYLRTVASDVDIGMQASFTESFNFVALDHLYFGKPVVGSPAVRYLPQQWQADPDDPMDISEKVLDSLDDYAARTRDATRVSRTVAKECNAAFIAAVERLLEMSL